MTRITGTGGADYMPSWGPGGLAATDSSDTINTGGGDDYIWSGGGGADHIDTGTGNDMAAGGLGNDWVAGQTGNDALYGDWMPQGDGYETDPEGGNDSLYGGAGNDLLDGQGGNDRLSASIGDDVLVDSLGTNRLFGGDGNDYLSTGSGLESGGRGFDWLDAENYDHGARINLNGGGEGDSFRAFLNGTDDPSIAHTTITVEDFHRGQGDRLLLAAGVTQADGSHYIQGADLFNAFDSNHSGKLGDGDAHAFADAGGVHAQWFNTDIIIHGDATSAADWLS